MIINKKFKKLNSKGMTLIEVVASMAILALISLGIYNGAALILRGFEMGQFVYESNSVIENRLESGTVTGAAGSVTFDVNGSQVVVNGFYHSDSETKDGMKVSYSIFKP